MKFKLDYDEKNTEECPTRMFEHHYESLITKSKYIESFVAKRFIAATKNDYKYDSDQERTEVDFILYEITPERKAFFAKNIFEQCIKIMYES